MITALSERRLLSAILHRAVSDIASYTHSTNPQNRRLAEEAWRWIDGSDQNHITSFGGLCSALGLDPASLRRRLTLIAEGVLPKPDERAVSQDC